MSIVIKLGGAALTDKSKFETLSPSFARHIDLIKRVYDTREMKLVLVHGAGSYGHFQAKKYALNGRKANLREPEVLVGFADCRRSVKSLNNVVTESLLGQGVPAVGISPFGLWDSTAPADSQPSLVKTVQHCVEQGLIPVLHGDAILDGDASSSIISGDVLMTSLALGLNDVRHAVYITDVPGVFAKWPTEEHPLPEIMIDEQGRIVSPPSLAFNVAQGADTTGGMAMKVKEASEIAANGPPVIVTSCEFAESATLGGPDVVLGDINWKGTVIRRER